MSTGTADTVRRRTPGTKASALIVLLFATACTSDTPDEPTRPPITRPLDAGPFAERVCDLLPNEQATRLGYPTPGYQARTPASKHTSGHVSCLRLPPESSRLDIELYLAEDRLAYEYRGPKVVLIDGNRQPWLEPLTIAGQPAAALGRRHQGPNRSCAVVVGLTDSQSLQISAGQQYSDGRGVNNGTGDGRACDHAIAVAQAIVHTLGG